MVSTGVSERGTRWLVVEPFARELPAHPLGTAQWLLPARLAICAAGLLHLGCPAARIAHKTSALLRIPVAIAKEWRRRLKQRQTEKTGSRAIEHLTLLASSDTIAAKGSAGSRAPASSGKTSPPAPLGELVGGRGGYNLARF